MSSAWMARPSSGSSSLSLSSIFVAEFLDSEHAILDAKSMSFLKTFLVQAGGLRDVREVTAILPKLLRHALGISLTNRGIFESSFWMSCVGSSSFSHALELLQPDGDLFQILLSHELFSGGGGSSHPRIHVPLYFFDGVDLKSKLPLFLSSKLVSQGDGTLSFLT